MSRAPLSQAGGVLVALLVIALLLGQLLGQPILLGYVATGSMEPAMNAGDGFVAIPSLVSGPVEEGDVVVFDAAELHDGGLTTHRVVGETDDGYVTRGDANPFTDQDGGEPHVTDGQIVAVAMQFNGNVVTIPHLGTAIMAVHGVVGGIYGAIAAAAGVPAEFEADNAGALLVGVGVALLGFGLVFDRSAAGRRVTTRSTSRENVIAFWSALALVLLVLVTLATAAMVLPSGVTEYGLVSTDEPTDDPQVVAPGETAELTRTIDNAGYLPIVTVLEPASGAVDVDPGWQTVGIRGTAEASVSLTASQSTGQQTRHVGEYRYLAVAPPSLLVWLHTIHPLAAITVVNGVVVAVTSGLVVALVGRGDLRLRRPGHDVPLSVRVARTLRRWR